MSIFHRAKRADRGRASAAASEPAFAPGTSISYEPALITRFLGQHKTLWRLYEQIDTAAQKRDYGEVRDKLSIFQRVLNQHLLEERLRLYVYLSKCLAADADSGELVEGMKREMSQIGRSVRNFIGHYVEFGVDQNNVTKFRAELTGIGATLRDRLDREENSLYTLYLPPGDYA